MCCYYFSHFTEEETEAQRCEATCPRLCSCANTTVDSSTYSPSIGYLVHDGNSINRGLFPFIKEDNFTSTLCYAVDDFGHCTIFRKVNNLFQTLNGALGIVILLLKAGFSWMEPPISQPSVLGNALDPPPTPQK